MIVTGGSGFIGQNLLNKFDGFNYDKKNDCDILTDLPYFVSPPVDIVHLAAESGVPFSIEKPKKSFETNVAGSLNVLDYAVQFERKVILASSAAAARAENPYGAYKKSVEIMAESFHKTYGLRYIALRFSNVYGPHSMHKDSVVAKMCKDALRDGLIKVYGDCSRDFIHVDDVCSAIKKSLESDYNGVLSIGTGVITPIDEIAIMISDLTGAAIENKPGRIGDEKTSYQDPGKASDVLGWDPRKKIEDGLAETLEWFRENI